MSHKVTEIKQGEGAGFYSVDGAAPGSYYPKEVAERVARQLDQADRAAGEADEERATSSAKPAEASGDVLDCPSCGHHIQVRTKLTSVGGGGGGGSVSRQRADRQAKQAQQRQPPVREVPRAATQSEPAPNREGGEGEAGDEGEEGGEGERAGATDESNGKQSEGTQNG